MTAGLSAALAALAMVCAEYVRVRVELMRRRRGHIRTRSEDHRPRKKRHTRPPR